MEIIEIVLWTIAYLIVGLLTEFVIVEKVIGIDKKEDCKIVYKSKEFEFKNCWILRVILFPIVLLSIVIILISGIIREILK